MYTKGPWLLLREIVYRLHFSWAWSKGPACKPSRSPHFHIGRFTFGCGLYDKQDYKRYRRFWFGAITPEQTYLYEANKVQIVFRLWRLAVGIGETARA